MGAEGRGAGARAPGGLRRGRRHGDDDRDDRDDRDDERVDVSDDRGRDIDDGGIDDKRRDVDDDDGRGVDVDD
jgi:hypothetical protein